MNLAVWPHQKKDDLLGEQDLEQLRAAVLESPYLAETDLNEGFSGTRGFSLLFKRSERERAEQLMPALIPYFEKVLKSEANVFFLNPLVIVGGGGVGPHTDKTLTSYVDDPPFPFCVSVLYLKLPQPRSGGDLVFHRFFLKRRVIPRENLLVEFPGWLLHEVTELSSTDPEPRISMVLEQYRLEPEQLQEVRDWHLETMRPFEDFLTEEAELDS